MYNIPKKIIASGCHFLKEIDQVSWRFTWEVIKNTYLKSSGYSSAPPSFMGILAILSTPTIQFYSPMSFVAC